MQSYDSFFESAIVFAGKSFGMEKSDITEKQQYPNRVQPI
jgi:hypothetical protein